MGDFADNLRSRLNDLGLTYAEAARRCGLSERRFANYCTGDREPDLKLLAKIATTLDISTDTLLGLTRSARRSDDERSRLQSQLSADLQLLDGKSLTLAAALVRTVIEHQRGQTARKR